MIDSKGYRPNVGIILCNDDGRVFWAKRKNMDSWQFPQGGIDLRESAEEAMYRELWEETGLTPESVEILGRTRYWLRYRLPERFIRKNSIPLCVGQKQVWFILRLTHGDTPDVRFDCGAKPEFDDWKWVDYWFPLSDVIFFKRKVYKKALMELGDILLPEEIRVSASGFLEPQPPLPPKHCSKKTPSADDEAAAPVIKETALVVEEDPNYRALGT